MSVNLTESAKNEIKRILEENKMSTTNFAVRIGVNEGCHEKYQFNFESMEKGDVLNDIVYAFDDIKVKVNRLADGKLDQTSIDFYEDQFQRGFVFNNPNTVKGGCGGGGCGSCGH